VLVGFNIIWMTRLYQRAVLLLVKNDERKRKDMKKALDWTISGIGIKF